MTSNSGLGTTDMALTILLDQITKSLEKEKL